MIQISLGSLFSFVARTSRIVYDFKSFLPVECKNIDYMYILAGLPGCLGFAGRKRDIIDFPSMWLKVTPLVTNGYSYSYHLDEYIFIVKDIGSIFSFSFLAHLSRRLIGELIVYPWSGVRRPSVVRRPFTMLKQLLLRNRWADQSQILCGASLGRGNDILFAASGSHDQDGRHAHIW